MFAKFPISKFGLILTALYILVAIFIVREDRRSTTGGWITLQGIGAFLITLPVSAVMGALFYGLARLADRLAG